MRMMTGIMIKQNLEIYHISIVPDSKTNRKKNDIEAKSFYLNTLLQKL